ncbi:hypothetical protein [Carboxylicivirga marina]|uniref:hypothetical protein n=1 Tax=Carboxylicivirga marina TaxID=2800988 RepID=UPI002593BD13|nr:hypothetical protein [uncultured Carboxylicivirga sp.]
MTAEEKLEKAEKKFNRLINVLWGIAIFLGIGSISGILAINEIIDSRVNKSVTKQINDFDKFQTAINLADHGEYFDALNQLKTTWNTISFKPTISLTDYYYRNLVWILGSIEVESENRILNTSSIWNELKEDKKFTTYKSAVGDDENFNYSYAMCILLYDNDSSFLTSARKKLQITLREERYIQRADYLFNLAMLDLVEGKTNDAKLKLQNAHNINPDIYHFDDYKKYINSFLNSQELVFWEYIYNKAIELNIVDVENKKTFKEIYVEFVENEIKAHNNV